MERIETENAAVTLYRDAPHWEGRRTAALGDFSFTSTEAGVAALNDICDRLGREGVTAILAPMQGDTWHRYRVVTESDGSPAFPMEPASGFYDLSALRASGFSEVQRYLSTCAPLDMVIKSQVDPPNGIAITPWDGSDPDRLLAMLYEMSLAAFADNPFYKPITREAFMRLYAPLAPAIDPRFVLFARDSADTLKGFLFAYPDPAQRADGFALILKTYASSMRGVGHALADRVHREAQAAGFTMVIHALIHENNLSRQRSAQHGTRVMRRYALMGKSLE